jgi:hypothetical protein
MVWQTPSREAWVTRAAIATAWQVRVVLRSGREGAVWTLSDEQSAVLERLWTELQPAAAPPRPTPDLSYAGLLVNQGAVEFLVHAIDVERRDETTSEHRHDLGRHIEALLLASAPEGSMRRPA